mmetsp:Transcript_11363/g.20769  ORF Transcript_11363/g.20769 Transcript_11363/m.20769 type:complete len:256 (+) Transcript_11363:159-926(+)
MSRNAYGCCCILVLLPAALMIAVRVGKAAGRWGNGQLLRAESLQEHQHPRVAGSTRQKRPPAKDTGNTTLPPTRNRIQQDERVGGVFGLWRNAPQHLNQTSWHKQDPLAVTRMLRHRRKSIFTQGSRMPVALPQKKLFFCIPPKVSCTSIKALIVRMIGVATPDDMCSADLARLSHIVHPDFELRNQTPAWVQYPNWTWPQQRAWADALSASQLSSDMLRDAFLSPAWTTIQVVRDPFYRAVSSYQDQARLRYEA